MKNYLKLIELVREEVKPAIGCTEPVAVAVAAAVARKYFHTTIERVKVKVCLSIYKNGKCVMIPGTDECGLPLAAALGVVAGDPESGFNVFKNVDGRAIDEARKMLAEGIVTVEPVLGVEGIFVEVLLEGQGQKTAAVLKHSHTHIERVEVNDLIVYQDKSGEERVYKEDPLWGLTFKDLKEIAEKIDFQDISFILEGVEMNKKAAEQGLQKNKGLTIGSGLKKLMNLGKLGADPVLQARILTAAGADFRMGGGNCPVMTSGGSGNQGLGVILPIAVVGEEKNVTDEQLARAIFFAHTINLFVKKYTGKLSALCGCAIAAGIGASAGIAWILGGDDNQIAGAVKNMLANLTGMICDGAKESCALKLSTSAGEAVISAYLSCSGVIVPAGTGIIGNTAEETIQNIGLLCERGLTKADEVLVDILTGDSANHKMEVLQNENLN